MFEQMMKDIQAFNEMIEEIFEGPKRFCQELTKLKITFVPVTERSLRSGDVFYAVPDHTSCAVPEPPSWKGGSGGNYL